MSYRTVSLIDHYQKDKETVSTVRNSPKFESLREWVADFLSHSKVIWVDESEQGIIKFWFKDHYGPYEVVVVEEK